MLSCWPSNPSHIVVTPEPYKNTPNPLSSNTTFLIARQTDCLTLYSDVYAGVAPILRFPNHGFGMWIDLLTMRQPWMRKRPAMGWNSKAVPVKAVPSGMLSRTQPCETQYAIVKTSAREVGIGVPSKYFDLPVASLGRTDTVTLKRARRVRPQRMKKASRRWSTGVRTPIAKAAAAGETPKETCGRRVQYHDWGCTGECSYQIGERVKLLAHHGRLSPPSRDLAIHEVKEKTKRYEA